MSTRYFSHESGAERKTVVWRPSRLAALAVAAMILLCGGSLAACGDQSSTAPSTSTTRGGPSSTTPTTTATVPTGTRSFPSNSKPPTPTASCPQPTTAVPVAVYCSKGMLVDQCYDGKTVPFPPGCPGAGGALRCPDGTIIQAPEPCPGETVPPGVSYRCPDGTITEAPQPCPGETVPPGRPCADGSSVPEGGLCPEEKSVQCPDGSTVPPGETCPTPTSAGPQPERETADPPPSDSVSTGSAPSPPVNLAPQAIESGDAVAARNGCGRPDNKPVTWPAALASRSGPVGPYTTSRGRRFPLKSIRAIARG
jgi:hypothetical protein